MKKVKIITILLAIVLISMVAFFGIYSQVQNRMENQVRSYSYAMDLKGTRNVRLVVSKENKTTIKDKEGNEVENSESVTEEQIAKNGYTKEETPYNSEDILTVENYKKSKEIIENRLKKSNVDNYIIKLDEQTGDIIIELTEDDNTDSIIGNLNTTGKFKIIDSDTKEVLMDNNDIKLANVMYGSGSSSTSTANAGTTVNLNIEFNKEGTKKLEDITSKYVKVEKTTEQNGNEENSENTVSENSESQTTDTTSETLEETSKEKKITIMVDDQEITSTSFKEPIKTGKLKLSVGQASTDNETLQGYIKQASSMATVLDTENMPVKYDVDENEYILSEINQEQLHLVKYIAFGIVILGIILLILKYKTNGLLGAFSLVGLFALMMMLVRYTNVVLSIEGLFAIGLVLILECVFIKGLLEKIEQNEKENSNKEMITKIIKETYVQFFIGIIPACIAVITFCFIKWIPISSFGMVMFWGIALIAIYNFIVTGSLLKIKAEKK